MDLSPDTRKDYTNYSGKVLPVFGKTDPNKIKPERIRRYRDLYDISSRMQANREKSFLSRVFRWGYERGFVERNQCQGVKFKEVSRERYVTDEEYNAVYEFGADVVRAAMEIAYLCVARQSYVLSLS